MEVRDDPEFTVTRDGVALSGQQAGAGVPVVLLHGLTATRRYVVMGSRALERSGHRVVMFDARGHGHSAAAPRPDGYGYRELTLDLAAVMECTWSRRWRSDGRWGPTKEASKHQARAPAGYLDQFTFRFNRRRSRACGMLFYRLLEQSVPAPPRTYRSLVLDPTAGRRDLTPPPPDKRIRPDSLDSAPLDRPWRGHR